MLSKPVFFEKVLVSYDTLGAYAEDEGTWRHCLLQIYSNLVSHAIEGKISAHKRGSLAAASSSSFTGAASSSSHPLLLDGPHLALAADVCFQLAATTCRGKDEGRASNFGEANGGGNQEMVTQFVRDGGESQQTQTQARSSSSTSSAPPSAKRRRVAQEAVSIESLLQPLENVRGSSIANNINRPFSSSTYHDSTQANAASSTSDSALPWLQVVCHMLEKQRKFFSSKLGVKVYVFPLCKNSAMANLLFFP